MHDVAPVEIDADRLHDAGAQVHELGCEEVTRGAASWGGDFGRVDGGQANADFAVDFESEIDFEAERVAVDDFKHLSAVDEIRAGWPFEHQAWLEAAFVKAGCDSCVEFTRTPTVLLEFCDVEGARLLGCQLEKEPVVRPGERVVFWR